MGKSGSTRSNEPQAAERRRKIGRFHAKQGQTELKEVENRAVARRQEMGMTRLFIGLLVFAIFSCFLYLYLSYAVAEDDESLES